MQPDRKRPKDNLAQPRGKTRSDILNMLKRSDGLTADQIASQLGVTSMAVRKHLLSLESDELVVSSVVRQPIGRPARVYRLSDASDDLFPKQYDSLALEFLIDLASMDGPTKIDTLFNRRAERAFAYLEQRVSGASCFDERVEALAQGMDELGYLASWEKTGQGVYTVYQFNCAIQRIASTFPQACFYELETYRKLLDADVQRSCHIMSGDHMCSYVIRQRGACCVS